MRNPNVQLPPIKILNSLTRFKNDFIPADPEGKTVTWYTCGPTVYDDAHLGHARNYVSTDVLRRIMKDYFGFRVKFVVNITDIDDKIILRARQQHLLAQFKEKNEGKTGEVLETTSEAFKWYIQKNLPLLAPETTPEAFDANVSTAYQRVLDGSALKEGEAPGENEAKIKMAIRTASSAAQAIQAPPAAMSDFYDLSADVLLPYLDAVQGSSIDPQNHEIFASLAKKFENRFFEDMENLNVLPPDVITRVSEYVPQVVSFVEKIISNGFGYIDASGSVYFDIDAFEKAGHFYARLEPWNRNDKDLQADGEGALSKSTAAVKRNDSDFALWKASKPGEPSWPSPWSQGRPGWHVECSVMASDVIGSVIDLHSGGEDLKFPHHDNELAQSTAYWSTQGQGSVPWVNYFIHTGHLGIQGLKMSKSLKNFTTIRAALESEWNARSLRIAFLLGSWQDRIELGDELLAAVAAWESRLDNLFIKAIDVARSPTTPTPTTSEEELQKSLQQAKEDVHAALCDSFNTPAAMRIMSALIVKVNSADQVADDALLSVARWVTKMVTIFGLDPEGNVSDEGRIGWGGVRIPRPAVPFIYPLSHLRDTVRLQARANLDHTQIALEAERARTEMLQIAGDVDSSAQPYRAVFEQFYGDIASLAASKALAKDFLILCDKVRDTQLPELGIYLEDRPTLPALVRPLDKALAAALEERKAASAAKAAEAQARRNAEEAKRKQAAEKAKLSPVEMFRNADYSEWDEQGIPIKDKDGKEVTKNQKKKLTKEWEKQKKLHDSYLAGSQK
jgi:cysteinyl-tRNA synthetase